MKKASIPRLILARDRAPLPDFGLLWTEDSRKVGRVAMMEPATLLEGFTHD